MASVLSMQASQKQKEKDNDDALRLLREQHAQREKDWAQQLEKAKMDQARSRRPVVWRRRHAIFMNRLQERRSRVVYFSILTAMLRAGRPESLEGQAPEQGHGGREEVQGQVLRGSGECREGCGAVSIFRAREVGRRCVGRRWDA